MNRENDWHGKPYYSLDAWCKNTFQHKCYKIALNAHLTCPNRDGSKGTRGCIFCGDGGSGDFAVSAGGKSMEEQLSDGAALLAGKVSLPDDKPCIIAYFQAYTNTYGPIPYLRRIFTEALASPRVMGISIATRPDCLPPEVMELLASLKEDFPHKFIWVELGLQTIHEDTARFIRRGYELPCFEDAMVTLKALDIPVIVHLIIGLPGESRRQMLDSVCYINAWRPFGVKLQLLHVLKNTDLAVFYERGALRILSEEAYLNLTVDCLEYLSPDVVVHRVTGDGPKKLLLAPLWSRDKRGVLNRFHHLMKERGAYQGRLLTDGIRPPHAINKVI